MSDITMCKGTNCPYKEKCRRYTATPNEYRQSYFAEAPIQKDNTCQFYWGENADSILGQLKDIVNGNVK